MPDEDSRSPDSSVSGDEGHSTFEQLSLQKATFDIFGVTFWEFEVSSNLWQALRPKEADHLFRAEKRTAQLSAHAQYHEQ